MKRHKKKKNQTKRINSHSETFFFLISHSPPCFDQSYFANATAVPGPRAVELSVVVLSGTRQIWS